MSRAFEGTDLGAKAELLDLLLSATQDYRRCRASVAS